MNKPELSSATTSDSGEPEQLNEEKPTFRLFKNLSERRRSSVKIQYLENGFLDEEEEEDECKEEEYEEQYHYNGSEKSIENYSLVSLPPELERRRKLIYNILHTLDVFLSILLFSPLVAIYWYFTWQLIDDYFLKDKPKLSNFLSWSIGLSVLFPDNFETIGPSLQIIMRIVYIYIIALAVVLEWRSMWNLISLYFYPGWQSQFVLAVVCLLFFCFTKSTHTLANTPFILHLDDYRYFFTTESKHQLPLPDYHQFGLDFLFNELIEVFALVGSWRGIEIAFDNTIFTRNRFNSILTSFVISHAIYLLIAIIQTFIFRRFLRSNFITRLVAEDLIHILMFFSAVLSWKFYWDLVDHYILKEKLHLYMLLFGHFSAFFIAVALQVSAILVGPGTSYLKDAEFIEPPKTYFQINYLSTIFKHHLEREIEESEESRLGSQDII